MHEDDEDEGEEGEEGLENGTEIENNDSEDTNNQE